MSFANDVKKELCSISNIDVDSLRAEFYSMLLLSKVFTNEKIIFKTENKYTANRFVFLASTLFQSIVEKKEPGRNNTKTKTFSISIINSLDCKKIFDFYGHDNKDLSLRVNRSFVNDENEIKSFIKGAFLSCGSVADPEKFYHLELCVPRKNLCLDICRIIREIQDADIKIKMLQRNGNYIAYLKDSEQITDLLTFIGATNASMNIMGNKALKQIRNSVNRKANSEIANLQKVANASARQIKAIKKLKSNGKFNLLSHDLQEIAQLRYDNPELSLRDLGEMLDPKLSRSGVNHRLEKIIKIADEG